MLYLIIRNLALALFKIYCRLQVLGRNNIPLEGGFILAGNHTSYLDPPLLAAACPREVWFLAKEVLFRLPVFGSLIRALHAFPLKTKFGDLKALRWAIGELKAGKAVVIFPEGARTADGEFDEPLNGVGFLAAKANCPIIPAFIEGSTQALPINSKFVRPRKIKVYFGQPLRAEQGDPQLSDLEIYEQVAQKTMAEIRKLKERGELN